MNHLKSGQIFVWYSDESGIQVSGTQMVTVRIFQIDPSTTKDDNEITKISMATLSGGERSKTLVNNFLLFTIGSSFFLLYINAIGPFLSYSICYHITVS